MPEHTVAERLRERFSSKAPGAIEQFDTAEQGGTPTPAPTKKKKRKERIGVGLNESNKKANAILVKLAAKMRATLDKGAKPNDPAVQKIRKTMQAINETRIN